MAHHNFGEETMSESIEMYLLRVALLQADDQPVPIPQLAQELAISPVSAHEMCRKLTDKGLVQYEPYKGVTLTTPGETLARRVLRCRRLWANFFGQKLGIEPQAADEMACRFEHVTPDELADRLAAYLDIPELASEDYQRQTCGLAQLTAGKRGRVVDLTADNVTNDFLKQQGIARGELITVLAVGANDTLLLEVAGRPMSLSQPVAQTVKVTIELEQAPAKKESTMTTNTKQITLDQLPLGGQGVVVRIGGGKSTRRRLLDMGMVPGETVVLKKVAPLGDPLELEIKNYQLSLRKNEASNIVVEVV